METKNFISKVNYKNIPIKEIRSIDEFNEIYLRLYYDDEMNDIVRTPSGGISIDRRKLKLPCWDFRMTSSCFEITVVSFVEVVRYQFVCFGTGDSDSKIIYGNVAYKIFKDRCKHEGIDLEDYMVENGMDYKKEIKPVMIKLYDDRLVDLVFENAHHIDFHSSYPAGLVNTHPEFYNVVKYFYDRRKIDPSAKSVLNNTIGYFQSEKRFGARLANLSRDAMNDNVERIENMTRRLIDDGKRILAYNTDGIWYCSSDGPYHGYGEGSDLGEWSNDYVNCKIRFKSAGSYEFIDSDGVYHPVVRGKTKLDEKVPRSCWKWGSIYGGNAEPYQFEFIIGVGIRKKYDIEQYV